MLRRCHQALAPALFRATNIRRVPTATTTAAAARALFFSATTMTTTATTPTTPAVTARFYFNRRFCASSSSTSTSSVGTQNSAATTTQQQNQQQAAEEDKNALALPEFFHALTAADEDAIHHLIADGFEQYWQHIRIKKGWAEAAYKKEEMSSIFHEAAECVFRIRHALDLKNPTSQVLRQLDGAAQQFLHSEEAQALFKEEKAKQEEKKQEENSNNNNDNNDNNRADETKKIKTKTAKTNLSPQPPYQEIVRRLVISTMSDAAGLREGLKPSDVDRFFFALSRRRFDPCSHFTHLLKEVDQRCAVVSAARSELLRGENEKCVESGSEQDRKWRAAIEGLYKVNTELSHVEKEICDAKAKREINREDDDE